MNVQSSAAFTVDGIPKRIVTEVSLDEIDAVGVRWCTAFSTVQRTNVAESLGTLLNIAGVCHEHGRSVHELGALRLAQRITGFQVGEVNARVAEVRTKVRFKSKDMPKDIRIVCLDESEVEFAEIISGYSGLENFWFPGATFGGVLGPAKNFLYDGKVHNLSFHLLRGKRRLATVPCLVAEDGALSWTALWGWEYPIIIHFADDCDQPKQVVSYAVEYLSYLSIAYAAKNFTIAETSKCELTLFRILGARRTMSAEIYDVPLVDLTDTEETIFRSVRASYRSHINWSKANLSVEYLSGPRVSGDAAPALYDVMNQVHARPIAKHGNLMPFEMFLLFTDKIGRGEGEIAIVRTSDGSICGMIATTYENQTAWYGLGGSLTVGNRNPGSFIVYDSMIRAKAHGLRTYHLGRVSPPTLTLDGLKTKLRNEMHNNLNFFKRGFSNSFDILYVYKVFPEKFGRLAERHGQ